jgi:NAD(P)-dependent dehydrogenase (short-subunit alcohol dehydrogenase family)
MMGISKFSLEGKIALITGGCQGIGHAVAKTFAEAGADVAISCRGRELTHLEKAAEEVRALGTKCLAIPSHVAKIEDSKNLVEKVKAEFGRIDILVNNAGANPAMAPLLEIEEWVWNVIVDVNMKGMFFLSQLVAREMKEQGGGVIINLSSFTALKPDPSKNLGFYSVSKSGVMALTRVMAQEWGEHNIRVNAIAPGWIWTRLAAPMLKLPGREEERTRTTALGRLGMPEDITGPALFLASDASGYVTGDTIFVEGGGILF